MSYDSLKEEFYRGVLDEPCHLPKYQDEPWADVVKHDRSYARWVANNLSLEPDLREALHWAVDNLYE